VLFCITSCKRRRPHFEPAQQPVASIPLDIPTPVSTCLYEQVAAHGDSIYLFQHSHDASFYRTFYESAMLDVGWHQESCVQGPCSVTFIFKKPRKWCTLILEPYQARFFMSQRIKKS
jgi:hypothetical protein